MTFAERKRKIVVRNKLTGENTSIFALSSLKLSFVFQRSLATGNSLLSSLFIKPIEFTAKSDLYETTATIKIYKEVH